MASKVARRGKAIPDQQILSFFISFYYQHGRWPYISDIDGSFLAPSSATVCNRFLSMPMAVHAAKMYGGILPPDVFATVLERREALLAQIQQHPKYDPLWKIRQTKIRFDPDFPALFDILFAFGTLDAFLRAANLPPMSPTPEELVQTIQLIAKRDGKSPTLKDCKEGFCVYAASLYLREFPSWNTLLRVAGLEINEEQRDKQSAATRQKIAAFDFQQYRMKVQSHDELYA